jgi:hypothetical protein
MNKREKIINEYLSHQKIWPVGRRIEFAEQIKTKLKYINETVQAYNLEQEKRLGKNYEKSIQHFKYDIESEIKHIDVDFIYLCFQKYHQ